MHWTLCFTGVELTSCQSLLLSICKRTVDHNNKNWNNNMHNQVWSLNLLQQQSSSTWPNKQSRLFDDPIAYIFPWPYWYSLSSKARVPREQLEIRAYTSNTITKLFDQAAYKTNCCYGTVKCSSSVDKKCLLHMKALHFSYFLFWRLQSTKFCKFVNWKDSLDIKIYYTRSSRTTLLHYYYTQPQRFPT